MKSLKNAESYERKRISERVKVSYSTVVIPSEQEKEMIREAEHWASTTEIFLTTQMKSLTYGSNELFVEAMEISKSDSNKKSRSYSEGYLHFAAMVRDLLGSPKYQSFRGFLTCFPSHAFARSTAGSHQLIIH